MMEHQVYQVAGLRVQVPFPVPEWSLFAAKDEGACDVHMIMLPAGQCVTQAAERRARNDHAFSLPGIGHFCISNGNEIRIEPDPDVGAAELRLVVLGSAWGSLCYQRGLLLLHGSAVQMNDGLVAFAGPSGAGKSSMTAAALRCGHGFWADDHLWLDLAGDEVRVHRGAPRLKLWRDTLQALEVPLTDLPRDHYRLDKYHAAPEQLCNPDKPSAGLEPLPLRHIMLLHWGENGIERLHGMRALRALLAEASYRPTWIPALGQAAWYWDACADIVRRVPVSRLTRPADFAVIEDGVARVASHVGKVSA